MHYSVYTLATGYETIHRYVGQEGKPEDAKQNRLSTLLP